MFGISKSKKCKTCCKKLPKDEETAIIRLDTGDGQVELEMCVECANLFERIADGLIQKLKGEHSE